MHSKDKLAKLREKFGLYGVAGYLQPVHDEFMSEYPPPCFQRVAWLSGFNGSAGMLVVLEDKAALFVDGRYTLQAAAQVDTNHITVFNSGEITPEGWIARECGHMNIGYDAALLSPSAVQRMARECEKKSVLLLPVPNLVDPIWQDRPAIPATPIFRHPEKYAGESADSKRARLAAALKEKGADAALIAAPESVCWLLNIRAHDTEGTPLILSRALLYADSSVDVFLENPSRLPDLGPHVRGFVPAQLNATLEELRGKKLLCDYAQMPMSVLTTLNHAQVNIVKETDLCVLPKACKNKTQIEAIRDTHVRDGAALTKLLHWLDTNPAIESVSEMEIADRLLTFRQENKDFVEPSFPTIAGAGGNGAIVHYRATEKTNRRLKKNELLLLDSGGQYPGGTTDVTRTIVIGTPTAEHKDRFTRVLKGHIAIATATFPKGMRGSQLDPLARKYLQEVGLDYEHGTGHGVGQFLGVHEGPQRISKRGDDAPLEVGMLTSNEPGYYKTGEYGIRIENLVVSIEKSGGELGFDTVTCAPIDTRLVEISMLSAAEKQWLNDYHAWVARSLAPYLNTEQKAWLQTRLTALV